jgi:serine/threonine-protein kinase
MPGSRSRFRFAISSSGLDTEEGREFLQERLSIFAIWNCVIAFAFLVLRVGLESVLQPGLSLSTFLSRPGVAPHLGANLVTFSVWIATRRRRLFSMKSLALIDAGMTLSLGAAFAAMGANLQHAPIVVHSSPEAMLTSTLAVAFTMVWRSVTVPSTPQRTGVLTTLAVIPLMVADILVVGGGPSTPSQVASTSFGILWAIAIVVISTLAANVVFGLRREVQKARRLGQYVLEEKIGEGAMGVVYRASHALLRRPTAIKLLPPERAGQKSLQRFEREVQLTARLTHPNTVAIFDYGRTPDGVFYYAMELLDGIDLEDLVRHDGPQPAGRVVFILRQVCRALAEAHGLGVIHRDIKPGNIILAERGGEPDVAKVVDFGLVKEIDSHSASATMSAEGIVLAGTPLYFSPEAITTPDSLDARSDLYAVGAVGYFLVTGQPLFEGRTIMELCAHHLHTQPTPPSVRLGRPIDADLESLLLACLAKAPDERPGSAAALADALGRCAAASDWSAAQARDWWDRYRAAPTSRSLPTPASETETVLVDLAAR